MIRWFVKIMLLTYAIGGLLALVHVAIEKAMLK